jgi:hypothetical protein
MTDQAPGAVPTAIDVSDIPERIHHIHAIELATWSTWARGSDGRIAKRDLHLRWPNGYPWGRAVRDILPETLTLGWWGVVRDGDGIIKIGPLTADDARILNEYAGAWLVYDQRKEGRYVELDSIQNSA